MKVVFVDSRSGLPVMTESGWDMPAPREGDIVETHSGSTRRWVVQEVDWVFEDAPDGTRDDVPLRSLAVVVCPEEEWTGKKEHVNRDPVCKCGHKMSMHAEARCLGNASTCECRHFEPAGLA